MGAPPALDLELSGDLVRKVDSDRMAEILVMVAQRREAVESQLVVSLFAWEDIATVGDEFGLIDPLTEHQLRVLPLISAGLTNAEIATLLSISENTVKTHVRHIYQK